MSRSTLIACALLLALAGTMVCAQNPCPPPGTFDIEMTAVAEVLGNPDNSPLFIVQDGISPPASISFCIQCAGIPVGIISLGADYTKTNVPPTGGSTFIDPFCSLAFPELALAEFPAGMPLPLNNQPEQFFALPDLGLVFGPQLVNTAIYLQSAGVQQNPNVIELSGGFTVAYVDPQDSQTSGTPLAWEVEPVANASRGSAMATGDLNGDGVDDLVVGHPGEAAGGVPGAGRVYIYFGTPGGEPGELAPQPIIIEEPVLSYGLPTGAVNSGPQIDANFGLSVAIGDVDGDMVPELIVAAPDGDEGAELFSEREGEVYVFSELSENLAVMFGMNPPIAPTVMSVPETEVFRFQPSTQAGGVPVHLLSRYGWDLEVGDVNGDLVDDLVVGAPFITLSPATESERGAVYVFLGGPLAMPMNPVDESILLQDSSLDDNDLFGSDVALGDLDNDGRDEILIGVPGETVGGMDGAGKIVAWALLGAPLTPFEVAVLPHPNPVAAASLGFEVVSGDFDGDGQDDVAASTVEAVGGLASAGQVHVWRVGPGLTTTYQQLEAPTPVAFDRFGQSLLAADLNDDGRNDLAVGTTGATVGASPSAGQVFVYFGTLEPTLDDPLRRLTLTSGSPGGFSLFGATMVAGDFSGSDVNSLVVGEPLASVPTTMGTAFGAGRVAIFDDLLVRRTNVLLNLVQGGGLP